MLIGRKGRHVSTLRMPGQDNILPKRCCGREIVARVCAVLVVSVGIKILQHHRDPLRDGVCGIAEIVGLTRVWIDPAVELTWYRAKTGGIQLSLRDISKAVGIAHTNVNLGSPIGIIDTDPVKAELLSGVAKA